MKLYLASHLIYAESIHVDKEARVFAWTFVALAFRIPLDVSARAAACPQSTSPDVAA